MGVRECWHLAGPPPTAFEIATGLLYGTTGEVRGAEARESPRTVLETEIRPCLARSPCVVAFSGGRDSSALLAVSLAVARREGWPEPLPVTLEFPGAATRERSWQERVVRTLRCEEWIRIPVTDELDMVGPVAMDVLRRHGLMYPANVHTIVPLARLAHGGAVVTGVGGDDVFGNWPWHDVAGILAGRQSPRPGDARRTLHALAPLAVRGRLLLRRESLTLPWLQPAVRRRASAALAIELSRAPRTWAARMEWTSHWRPWRATVRAMEMLGRDHRTVVISPFLEPAFLAALAQAGRRWGWGDRTATMRTLFGDLLPEQILSRRSKAEFSEPFFGRHVRSFARRWDGHSGIDAALVDGQVLRDAWLVRQPHFHSALALQAAWLASNGREPRERAGRVTGPSMVGR